MWEGKTTTSQVCLTILIKRHSVLRKNVTQKNHWFTVNKLARKNTQPSMKYHKGFFEFHIITYIVKVLVISWYLRKSYREICVPLFLWI